MSQSICFNLQYSLTDQKFYSLPNLIASNFNGEPTAVNIEYLLKKLPKPLQEAATQAVAHLKEYLKIYDVEHNQKREISFRFEIPPSAFNSKITIFQKLSNLVQNEYNTVSKLQPSQIEQIFQTGTFEIPSKRFPIPYVWQLSSWVMKGRVNIRKSYYQNLGIAFSCIHSIPDRYYHENDHLNGFRFTIRSGLYNLVIKPFVYVGIIIGMREMDEYTNVEGINWVVEFMRQTQLRKNPLLDQSVYKYLKFEDDKEQYKKVQKLYQKLIEYATQFENDLSGMKMYMTNLYDLLEEKQQNQRMGIDKEEQEEYRENLKEELNQSAYYAKKYNITVNSSIDLESQIQKQIYLAQIQHWKQGPFDEKVINQICNLVECERIYNYYLNLMNREIQQSVEIFKQQLIKQSPVKTECRQYLNYKIDQFKKSIKPSLKNEMIDNIVKELKSMKIPDVQVYENYYETKKQMKLQVQQKIKSKEFTQIQASNQIICKRQCFPPYKVLYENGYYHLQRVQKYHINSNYYGWRLVLMILTWYTWTVNVMYWLSANAIQGPLGIRALLSFSKFHPEVQIDRKTGQIYPDMYEVTPISIKLKKVYNGMMTSRSYFENSPDTGFFGKNYSRLWNLVEVYIFRMIFVGILLNLILLPSIIICNVIISLLLAITAWAWQPFAILFIFLFKILIFDFDLKGSRASLWRQRKGIPLIINTYHILVNGILQILISLLYIVVLAPLFALIVTIYSTSRRFLRSCFDSFMIRVIKILGRVPASESNLAWKISGPGLSRKYYYGITNQQVILMICAELEKMILTIYQNQIKQYISQPSIETQQLLSDFVRVFHANIHFSDQGVSLLEKQLSKQIEERLSLFPKLSVQVRFTEQELILLLKQVKQFVKAQMNLKDLSKYIWDHYNIKKGDYNSLTETLLTKALGSQVLEPFEDVEMRFSLVIQIFKFRMPKIILISCKRLKELWKDRSISKNLIDINFNKRNNNQSKSKRNSSPSNKQLTLSTTLNVFNNVGHHLKQRTQDLFKIYQLKVEYHKQNINMQYIQMEEEQNADDKQYDFDLHYSLKDDHFYQLPNQVPCDFQGQKVIDQLISQYQDLPEETKDLALGIVHKFQNMLKIWDVPNNNQYYSYPFKFPPSTFKKKIDIFDKYPKMNQIEVEYNEVSDLSKEQISSIFQRGTFEIPSKIFPIPYVWKLSTWVIKGREPINKSLCFDIGYAYNAIRTITQRIYKFSNDDFNLTLAKGIKNLVIRPLVYISILIGFRQMQEYWEVNRIYNDIEADRQFKLQQIPNINKAIYIYLRKTKFNQIEADEKFMNLIEYANQFNSNIEGITFQMQNLWDLIEQQNNRLLNVEDEEEKEYKGNIQAQLAEMQENYIDKYGIQVLSDQHIQDQIQNALHLAQIMHWESNQLFEKEVIRNIIDIAECFRIYNYYHQIMNIELHKQLDEFEMRLRQEHPIRIHCQLYAHQEIENFRQKISRDLEIETEKKILFDLKDLGEVQIYQDYVQNRNENQRLVNNRISQNLYLTKEPSIEIKCKRKCFPKYKVLRDDNGYRLEREKTYKIDSRCFGWKLQLIVLRWFTWSVTVMYWLFANAISGPIGIRALCSINEFHPDVEIDRQTGRIYPTEYTVTPVIAMLQNVYKGMRDSRNEFENAPDTGFFGKNCARICNLCEVYIFRFLIVGVLIVIIIIPIIIIINFVVSLTLAITAFAWIPIFLIFWYLFSITIYDFDVENNDETNLFFITPWFPIFVNTFQLLWCGVFQTILCLLLIFVLQPALAFFTIIFALLRYILRSLYDCLMILFVKCLGRVPAYENNLAWKISGPGQSIKHFYAVSMEQLIILVAAELEKCVYEKYKAIILDLINTPSQNVQQIIYPFFKEFNAFFKFNDPGCQKLINSLEEQIVQKFKLLPKINVKVKFTQLELIHALKITKQFVKTQIILKDLSEYIWEKYAIRKGDYNSLVEKLFILIFGAQILEPFEDVDMRFSLDQTESAKLMNQVQKALKGKINLEMPQNYTIKKNAPKKEIINKEFVAYSGVRFYTYIDIEQYMGQLIHNLIMEQFDV